MSEIGWVAVEYVGTELCTPSGRVIKEFDELKVGDVVIGWYQTIVQHIYKSTKTASGRTQDGKLVDLFEFDHDDRHCWVHNGSINAKLFGPEILTFKLQE
jgi:hypothetical protein